MFFIQIEDGESAAEVILFPKTFARVEQWLTEYHVFLVKGAVDITDPTKLKLKAFQMAPVERALQEWPQIQQAIFELPAHFDEAVLTHFKEKLVNGTIPASCLFHEQGKKLRLSLTQKIALDGDILAAYAKLGISTRIML